MPQLSQHLKLNTFVHILLVCFALASVGTIAEFFLVNGHNWLTSYGLALALGFGLVLISIMLASTEMENRPAFLGMLTAVIVVATMSAIVQSMSYRAHVTGWGVAVILGVGFPLIECVLALGVSLHDAAERRKRIYNVRNTIQQRISESMGDAMAEIDVSRVRGYIERRVDGIIRQQLDVVIANMGLSGVPTITTTKQPAEPAVFPHNIADIATNEPAENSLPANHELNEARRRLVAQRHAMITQLCERYGAMSAPELVERLEADRNIQVSVQTVRDDCNTLVEAGELSRVGRKWDVSRLVIDELPEPVEPVLNGNGHG